MFYQSTKNTSFAGVLKLAGDLILYIKLLFKRWIILTIEGFIQFNEDEKM